MAFTNEKRLARKVLALSIASIGLGALPAQADDADEIMRLTKTESEIELGVGHVSRDSFKFGNYTGLHDAGGFGIANVRISRRGENDANYLDILGRNLGLDSRSLLIEGGQQGNFGIRLEYDQIPRLLSDSYQTPYLNAGSTNLTLPAGWVRGANTTAMAAQLNANMRPFDIESQRKTLGLALTKLLPAGWDVSFNFKRENRDGNRLIGATFGTGGGNPRSTILPEPTDYTTDQIEAIARYASEKLQLQFGYYGSFFKNDHSALRWQNAYAGTVWGGAAAAFPMGQIGLPPDNQFHQLNASGGYSFSPYTRLAGNLSIGRMTQDDTFLPYTVNPAIAITTPMPRSSLNGKINTTNFSLKLTSRLMPKLNLTASYRYDDRDNRTPQSQYVYIPGDSLAAQPVLGATMQTRTNLPGSSTKQQAVGELAYDLSSATKLKFGYEYDWVKKTFEAIDWEREHTLKAEVKHTFGDAVWGGLGYAYSDRTTSSYNAGAPYLASYTGAAYIATQVATGLWDNLPTQRKFFLAPRKRDKLRAFLNTSPTEKLSLQFGLDYKDDNYYKSEHGLQDATGWAANFDANLSMTEALTGHFFASYEHYGTHQRSLALGASKLNATNRALDWTYDIKDRTLTSGVGVRYKPGGKFEFSADLSHARSIGKVDVWTGPGIAAGSQAIRPMPDLLTHLTRLDLMGRYWVQKDLSVNVRYIFERYRSDDWGYDYVTPSTLANVIGTNQTSPDYSAHMIGVSASYRFW